MTPDYAHDLIREACTKRPELRFHRNISKEDAQEIQLKPYQGFCYIASKVFSHLIPEAELWTTDNRMHYWNVIDGVVWDLTKEQFDYDFIYDGHKVPRKPLSERAAELLLEVERINENRRTN